jgi:hypothetical protein
MGRTTKKVKNGNQSAFKGPSPDVGKATQFKPGNRGGGRPRTAKFAEACRQLAAEVGKDGRTGVQKLADYCLRQAMKGSARHAEMFLHYGEGKPAPRLPAPNADKFENASVAEIEDFREKLLRRETLEIPPTKPN